MTPDKLPEGDLVFGMVPLGKRRGSWRYAVYLLSPAPEMGRPLWGPYTPPETSDATRKRIAAETWPGMVYFPRPASGRDLPAWHFATDFAPAGWGADSKTEAFARALSRRIGRPIVLCMLNGWNAQPRRGDPAKVEG
jgi:hypothetical protein